MTESCAVCGEEFEVGDRITYQRFTTLDQITIDGEPILKDHFDLPRKPVHWTCVGLTPEDA